MELQCDLEILTAQACCMQKQQDEALRQKDETIDRYRRQLSASLEREKNLELKVMQQKLEWQTNCEDIKAKHYLDNEQLIQELTLAREKADAELVETKQQLQDLTMLLHCVKQERDQALQGSFPCVGSLASKEMERLQEQNSRLQAVVSQMRMQMEELSWFASPSQRLEAPATATTPTENAENKGVGSLKKQDVQHLESNLTTALDKQVLNPASMCPCGHVFHSTRECFQLYSRLKLAASCIVRLNRDKQQLIEMCNRLRAQISTAEVHYPVKAHLKKEQDSVEKTEDQSVSAVEQVPMTTQRLQSYSGIFSAQRSSEESLPSLRDLWALLDHGPSKAGVDLGRADASEQIADEIQMEVQGVSAPVHSQSTAKHLQRRSYSRAPLKTTSKCAITKIRNYNIKE